MIIIDMNPTVSIDGAAPLAHLGLIRARGDDAARFLNAQLTNELLSLRQGEARWAGFCSAKGRLQANFLVWSAGAQDVLLLCSADLLAATLKRLSMFVLRLQCKLSDASAELPLHGVAGASATPWAHGLGVFAVVSHADGHAIRLPDAAGTSRVILVGAPGQAPAGPVLDLERWRWLEVQSALPWIETRTVDRFVPQMLNQELIGAVDFHKGCYPGQEVVARSQYRGTIKRRMFLFDTEASAAAGDEVYWSEDREQPAGLVVNAARGPHGTTAALVEVKLAALEGGSLHLGVPDGPRLHRATMPYSVPLGEPA